MHNAHSSNLVELFLPYKLSSAEISLKFLQQSLIRNVQILVDFCVKKLLHFIKIRDVESWGQQGFIYFLFASPFLLGLSCCLGLDDDIVMVKNLLLGGQEFSILGMLELNLDMGLSIAIFAAILG